MKTGYQYIIVESYYESGSGLHGSVHIRPLADQDPFLPTMKVECPGKMKRDYPVPTKFRIRAQIISREGGPPFIYTSYQWPYEVIQS